MLRVPMSATVAVLLSLMLINPCEGQRQSKSMNGKIDGIFAGVGQNGTPGVAVLVKEITELYFSTSTV